MIRGNKSPENQASRSPSEARGPRRAIPGRWRRWAMELAVVVAIVLAVQWWQARPLASGMAPPLAGVDSNGEWLSLESLRGEPVLVHFWGSWCPVCRLMDGAIARIAEDHAVVSVALQSGTAPEVQAYLSARGLDVPAMLDPDGRLALAWGVNGVPASFVLDGEGRIRFATRGASSGPGLRLRLWLAGLSGFISRGGRDHEGYRETAPFVLRGGRDHER